MEATHDSARLQLEREGEVHSDEQRTVMLRVLSLGAGVQSSTLALMIAKGSVPMVDCAIFADTQWEPKAVYRWLDWLEKQLPFPVHHVTEGNLREAIMRQVNATPGRSASVPWHMPGAMGRRQCTREYKLDPLRRKMRELVGLRGQVQVCIGISVDEAHRMKPSRNLWQHHTWPLIDLCMTRADCLAWMERNGYPTPPKSSCLGCPYHSDQQWQEIKRVSSEWLDVIAVDKAIRVVPKMRNKQFMHRSCKPISEVEFVNEAQTDLFLNECEGMCGV
jgi:hypothetical protein